MKLSPWLTLKLSPWLTRPEWDTFTWRDDCYHRWSCPDVLRQYFKFPKQVKKIRFYVTARPMDGAYKVECSTLDRNSIVINKKTIVLYGCLFWFLKESRNPDKPVYFGVEYV